MSQVPEESFTQAQYRNVFKKRFEFTNVTVLGSDANGTHFQWDDARGERHFGVISDLLGQHRHTPASALSSINQSQANVTADTQVNSISFTPETAPYTFRMLWQFVFLGTDNDLDGVISQGFTLGIVVGGISKDSQQTYNPLSGAAQFGTLHFLGRGTTTAARTFVTRTRELNGGVPRDTVDISSSDLTVLVVYERRILV